jgi:hypothetical protein
MPGCSHSIEKAFYTLKIRVFGILFRAMRVPAAMVAVPGQAIGRVFKPSGAEGQAATEFRSVAVGVKGVCCFELRLCRPIPGQFPGMSERFGGSIRSEATLGSWITGAPAACATILSSNGTNIKIHYKTMT